MAGSDWRIFRLQLSAHRFSGHSALTWLGALSVFLVVFAALKGSQFLVTRLLQKRTPQYPRWAPFAIRVSQRTRSWFLGALAIVIATERVSLSGHTRVVVGDIAATAIFIQIAIWGNTLIRAGVDHYKTRILDAERTTTIITLGFIATLLLWILLTLAALDHLGVDVTALLAGLGIGGVALALAVQTTLADILASLSIMFDKPFVLGDFIAIDTFSGTVERIGLKTTHLRSPSGEQIILSNSDLVKSRVRNYRRMRDRTVSLTLYVTYENGYEQLARTPALIADIISHETRARFVRAHLSDYQSQGLALEVAYVISGGYADTYRDVQQAINLAIFRAFREQGILFCAKGTTPTQHLP
ncbi:MAG: mechanosensitive ion channel family protein [Acidiferrobacter sp.]